MITLLTDFGSNSIQIARAKAWITQHCPEQSIIDIAHDIHPNDINEAAYLFNLLHTDFEPGTIHIIAIDFDERHAHNDLLYFKKNNQHIFTYNSGLASLLIGDNTSEVKTIGTYNGQHYDTIVTAFGPAVLGCLDGKLSDQSEYIHDKLNIKTPLNPVNTGKLFQGHIVYFDARETGYTNISQSAFEDFVQDGNFDIILSRHEHISKITTDLKSLEGGGTYCYFNQAGLLTISVYRGSAKRMYGLKRGQSLMIEKR